MLLEPEVEGQVRDDGVGRVERWGQTLQVEQFGQTVGQARLGLGLVLVGQTAPTLLLGSGRITCWPVLFIEPEGKYRLGIIDDRCLGWQKSGEAEGGEGGQERVGRQGGGGRGGVGGVPHRGQA